MACLNTPLWRITFIYSAFSCKCVEFNINKLQCSRRYFHYVDIIRPPGTISSGRAYILPQMFFFVSPRMLRAPSTDRPETLPHGRNLTEFYKLTSKFGGRSPQQIGGPKTCKISVNFGPLQTLIANISGTAQDIHKRKKVTNYGNSSCVWWKKCGELWSTNGLEFHVSLDPLKCTFWQTILSP